jgi:hypothetical protein
MTLMELVEVNTIYIHRHKLPSLPLYNPTDVHRRILDSTP